MLMENETYQTPNYSGGAEEGGVGEAAGRIGTAEAEVGEAVRRFDFFCYFLLLGCLFMNKELSCSLRRFWLIFLL